MLCDSVGATVQLDEVFFGLIPVLATWLELGSLKFVEFVVFVSLNTGAFATPRHATVRFGWKADAFEVNPC